MAATWILTLALGGLVGGQVACGSLRAQELAPGREAAAQDPGFRSLDAPRLLDCIEAPYAYLSLDAGAAPAAGAGSERRRDGSPVLRLLGDPSLAAVFGADRQGGAAALSLVRSMLQRDAAEFELAMTGIVERKGMPLLVLRARLQRGEAQRLQVMLDAEAGMAVAHRRIGDRQTYVLRDVSAAGDGRSGSGTEVHSGGVGEGVELALCGDCLVIGNDGSAMREVLAPPAPQTSAAGTRRVLSSDARFLGLRSRANVQPGSLLVFGDWQRLGRRLRSSMRGAPAHLLGSSGLDSARAVMMTLSPTGSAADASFLASMQFDFDAAAGGSGAAAGSTAAGHRHQHDHQLGIDGWFAATEAVEARSLLRELPHGDLGGLVLSVDLAAIAATSPRSAHLVWDLRDAFDAFGLDFERNVLGRLGRRGTVQLSFAGLPDAADGAHRAAVAPAWALRATSRKAAGDLFTDLRRVAEAEGLGRVVDARDARGKRLEVLSLGGGHHHFTAFVAVAGELLLLAETQEALLEQIEDLRSSRPRRRDQAVTNALQAIGREHVSGLFDLDLEPLFARIGQTVPGIDLSALPRRHAGTIVIDRHADGTVVSIQLVSSQ